MTGLQEYKARSIRSRLILILLYIFVPVLAIQAYIYYDSYQTRRDSELQANLEIARLLAKSFESFVQDVIHQELAIGLAITSSQPMLSKDITRLLETSWDYVAVRDFTWVNTKGIAIYSSNPAMIGINYSDRSYFREIVNGREWMVSELLIAKTTGQPAFGISRGIRDDKGALAGVVFAAVVPEKLDLRLASIRGKGGGYALVDNKGIMVYRYPAINATWEERNWLKQYPQFGEALKGKEITATVYAPFEGKNRLVGFTPVFSLGWAASAGKREEDIIGPILRSIGASALLFLSVAFVAFFVALTVSRRITSSVTALHAHALALGHGEVPGQGKISDVLEFQDLAEAFNTMAEKVQARETDLRESGQRWATTLASIGDAVIATDVEGRITFMNTVAEELTGWTLNESAMKPVGMAFNIINEHTRKEVENPVSSVLREGMIVGLANHTLLIKKDGTEIPIDDSGAPIGDKEGEVMGVVLVFRDITARKQAEEKERRLLNEVQQEKDKLSALVNSIADEVWFADTQRRFVLANPAALKEFNLRPNNHIDVEKLAENLEVYRPDGSPRPVEETPPLRALNGEVVRNEEEIIRTPAGGDLRYRRVSAAPVRDASGAIIGSVSVVHDITDRKQAEEERERLIAELQATVKELDGFCYSISHDLKAPLRAIDGSSRTLLNKYKETLDEKGTTRLLNIRKSTKFMGDLINDLLAFSRLSRTAMRFVKVDMQKLVEEVWEVVRKVYQRREIELRTKDLLPVVGDPTLMRQVLINLLLNAAKFTRDRTPAMIEVSNHLDGSQIIYSIKDNGAGFDMQYADKLFSVFQRLHPEEEFEGTGVGLAIVQRIVHRHGGSVWAEGKVDEGATFHFSLPREPQNAEGPSQ